MEGNERNYINGWTTKYGKICLMFRDEKGDKRVAVKTVPWYFYVKHGEKEAKFLSRYYGKNYDTHCIKSGSYLRVYDNWDNKFELFNELTQQEIQTYEHDLSPLDLYMLDTDFTVADKYKKMYFDIETDDSADKIVIGKYRIVSIAYYDNLGNKEFICHDDEKTILTKFIERMDNYDIIIGWNSHNFDVPYIKERMQKHGMEYDWNRVINIDLMKRFIKIGHYKFELENYKLNTIAKYFIGEEKLDHSGKKIIDLFNEDRKLLEKYNLKDCEILFKLDESMNATEIMILEAKWCKTFLREFYVSKLLDMYILNEARKKKIHYPTKKHDVPTSHFAGALVLDPSKGIFDNVYVFDFKSLYPSIIMTFNISVDAIKSDPKDSIKTVNGLYFDKLQKGLVSSIIGDLLNKRQEIKAQMSNYEYRSKKYESVRHQQDAVKELTNSVYGILGDSKSRFFNTEIAESITLAGQWLTINTKEFLNEKYGMEVIYGDTDSVFVYNKGKTIDTEMVIADVHAFLENRMRTDFKINDFHIQLEYEKLLAKVFFVSKKRYAQKIVEADGKKVDYIEIIGLECRKSDTVNYAKRLQKHLIESVLTGSMPLDAKYHHKWINSMKKSFMSNKIPIDDIIIRQKITKEPKEYKTELAHVKIAKGIIERKEGFYVGMSVEYFVSNSKPKIMPKRIDEYDDEFDRDYYWNNRIYPMIERVYITIFPDDDWMIHYMGRDERKGQFLLEF